MGDGDSGRNEADDAYCELCFSPSVSLIATVRRFVEELYVKMLQSAVVTSRLVVATHELLENSVRYSVDGRSRIRVGVHRSGSECRVEIATQNRASEADRAALASLLDELRSAPERGRIYQTLMSRSAKRETGSGLGLGRIYAESELDFACEIDGETVNLVAEGLFEVDGGGRLMTEFTNIETPDLITRTTITKAQATVTMTGSAESTAMVEVAAFLQRLHERATRDRLGEVILDVRALQFMTSSCFKAFVGWIDRLQAQPPPGQYQVRFLYDERKHWQSRSLGALATLGTGIVRLETTA